jgi:type VI protein secretion system component Hcp
MKLMRFIPLLLGLCALQAHAAGAIRLTVTGVSCTSTLSALPGMAAESWSMGASAPISTGATGVAAGKVALSALTVQRAFDECSPVLLNKFFTESHIATVVLTQYAASADGAPQPSMVVTLTNVIIESYAIGGVATADASETWAFSYEKVCLKNSANGVQACYSSNAVVAS